MPQTLISQLFKGYFIKSLGIKVISLSLIHYQILVGSDNGISFIFREMTMLNYYHTIIHDATCNLPLPR